MDLHSGLGFAVDFLEWLIRYFAAGICHDIIINMIHKARDQGFVNNQITSIESYLQTATLLFSLHATRANYAFFKYSVKLPQSNSKAQQKLTPLD